MNFLDIIKRAIRPAAKHEAPCCVMHETAKLLPGARIWNTSGVPQNIIIGRNTYIAGTLHVWGNCGRIDIGADSFVGEGTRLYSAAAITIGDRVQIAHGCNIFDNNVHSLDPKQRHLEYLQNITKGEYKLFDLHEAPVDIRNDAWIGAQAIVMKGVVVGEAAIVGAGSVVVKSVSAHTVVVGNPAKPIKQIFDPGAGGGLQGSFEEFRAP